MFKNAKVQRIIPDKAGIGGSVTSPSTHSTNNYLRHAAGVYVYYGRWRKFPGLVLTPGQSQAGYAISLSLYNYAKIDTTNANLFPSNIILSHGYTPGSPNVHTVFDHTNNFTVRSANTTPDKFLPAVFSTVKNRSFICWAGGNNFIYDGTHTSSGVYDVGVNGPVTAPTYTLSSYTTGTLAATNNCAFVTKNTGSAWNPGFPISSITIGGVNYQVSAYQNANTLPAPGTATGTSGQNTLTISGAWTEDGRYNGITITISANNYIVASYKVQGANTNVVLSTNLLTSPAGTAYTIASKDQLILNAQFGGTTTLSVAYTAYNGSAGFAWGSRGPQYAYAYYDPITGHISNVSPIIQVTEQNQSGTAITLQNIVDSPVADRTRFTKIVIFRTILNGGTVLFPIGDGAGNISTPINNDGTGPHTFADSNLDVVLLVNGGLQAPINTNNKPTAFAHQAYWDGRMWGIPVNDPTSIVYSCDPTLLFGIAEESYPVLNKLRLPSDDGVGTGMRVVGNDLVITTNRYSYSIVGYNEATYRPIRYLTNTNGVGDLQMCEYVGDTTDNAASLIYLGHDNLLHIGSPTVGDITLSEPVHDIYENFLGVSQANYAQARVVACNLRGMRFIITSFDIGNPVLFYDLQRKVWLEGITEYFTGSSTVITQPEAWAIQYGSSTRPIDLLMIRSGIVYSVFQTDFNRTVQNQCFVATDVLESIPKKRRQINFVRIYVSDPSPGGNNWNVKVTTNETASFNFVPVLNPDANYQLQPSGATPIDAANAKELIMIAEKDQGQQLYAFRHQIEVDYPSSATTTPLDLYAIDICFSELEDPDDVSL